ncbi:hypothetical protein COTS27_00538 [Spirochaetota bacterium]|nr:hypothetical protein COTS27_00538 [Spirochaetota bacterium]
MFYLFYSVLTWFHSTWFHSVLYRSRSYQNNFIQVPTRHNDNQEMTCQKMTCYSHSSFIGCGSFIVLCLIIWIGHTMPLHSQAYYRYSLPINLNPSVTTLQSSQSGLLQSELPQSGLSQSELSQSGLSQSELFQSGLLQSELPQSGLFQSGLSQLELPQSESVQSGLFYSKLSAERLHSSQRGYTVQTSNAATTAVVKYTAPAAIAIATSTDSELPENSENLDLLSRFTGLIETEPTISLHVETTKKSLTIGEPFVYSVTLIHPPDLEILKPDPHRDLGAFTLVNYEITPTQIINNLAHYTIDYTIAIYQTGIAAIPPAEAVFITKDATDRTEIQHVITSLPITIEVVSLIENTDVSNEPFKSPYEITGQIPLTVKLVTMGVLLMLIGAVIFWIKRRNISAPKPPIPFYEQTRQSLEVLLRSFALHSPLTSDRGLNKIPKQNITDFYDQLSKIIRTHLSLALEKPLIMTLTTDELTVHPATIDLTPSARSILIPFLKDADTCKFTNKTITSRYAGKAIFKLYHLIESAKRAASAATTTPPASIKNNIENNAKLNKTTIQNNAKSNKTTIQNNAKSNKTTPPA